MMQILGILGMYFDAAVPMVNFLRNFLTYNLLTIASLNPGVPSILFIFNLILCLLVHKKAFDLFQCRH